MDKRLLSEAIRQARAHSRCAVIADIKMCSPRDGCLLDTKQIPDYLAKLMIGGIDAISIVTARRWFGGSLDVTRFVSQTTYLPLMRKDYFRTTEQIDQSLALGFTAVQLTLSTIGDVDLIMSLKQRAENLGLEVVLGVHTPEELDQVLRMRPTIIGINNRNIKDLETDRGTVSRTEVLAPMVPRGMLLVSESGLLMPDDVARAWTAGADAVLVGTAFAKSSDLSATLKAFLNAHRAPAIRAHF